ncbi:hypothetical protein [Parafilimonas sp.]|uniref:hypothetical protein n=1 Tax=Parafilimonas sp. TaxID=1969739 RepID=UPI0039E4763A
MFKNYLKTAWRNIIKHRFYSTVNIIGLSTGIAFTLLIAAYVWSELNVNKAIPEANRIFNDYPFFGKGLYHGFSSVATNTLSNKLCPKNLRLNL